MKISKKIKFFLLYFKKSGNKKAADSYGFSG